MVIRILGYVLGTKITGNIHITVVKTYYKHLLKFLKVL